MCARNNRCAFQDNKKVFCRLHFKSIDTEVTFHSQWHMYQLLVIHTRDAPDPIFLYPAGSGSCRILKKHRISGRIQIRCTSNSYEWRSYEWSVHSHSYKHKHLQIQTPLKIWWKLWNTLNFLQMFTLISPLMLFIRRNYVISLLCAV